MAIRLPGTPAAHRHKHDPLRRCVAEAAARSGLREEQVAIALTYFLEELTAQVALGRDVRIPGFGMFGQRIYASRMNPPKPPRPYPAFAAHVDFNRATKAASPVSYEAQARLDKYRYRHLICSGKGVRRDARQVGGLALFRSLLLRDAEAMGLET